ncbi:hypothetical protein ACF3NR_08150 [Vaginella massiliensis]|uniref:hypothetical protein n=1 Tax=Vaginella massiliensis TaxID=1816680 RepID=UPI003750E7AD
MKEALEQALILTKKHTQLVFEINSHHIDSAIKAKKISQKLNIERQMNSFLNDVTAHKFSIILDQSLYETYTFLMEYYTEEEEIDVMEIIRRQLSPHPIKIISQHKKLFNKQAMN